MKIPKLGFIKINILVLVVLVFGCALPFEWPNPNLEVIVPKEEVMDAWVLSLEGDKIVYSDSQSSFLLIPATQQKYDLNVLCYYFGWLDDTTLWCINQHDQALVISIDDFMTIPLQQIEAQQANLAVLLEDKMVYKLDYGYGKKKQALLVLDTDYRLHPNENYLIPVKDADPIWQEDYPAMYFPYKTPVPTGEKVYSPDKAFYFITFKEDNKQFITIYEANTDKKLAEYSEGEPNLVEFGGWADDSSGVYFGVFPGGMYGDGRQAFYKLKVPE
jgi:hypothetical protein